jgi:oligopeptide transport system substrate-binding protein
MKINHLATVFILVLILSACQSATPNPTAAPQPTATTGPKSTAVPTNTFFPTPTVIPPTPTPIPGKVTIPITSMKNTIPWLAASFDPNAAPGIQYYGFNTTKPPFDNILVRKAFAAAVDREAIAALATSLYVHNVQPATTFLSPLILGRNLYNEIGIPFDPARAKEYLVEAGYSDATSFPKTTFVISTSGGAAPGLYQQTAEAIVKMWKENLGIDVTIKNIGSVANLGDYLHSNPNGFDIFRMGLGYSGADMDPTAIELLSSNSELNQGFNVGHFTNDEFDKILVQARNAPYPGKRQLLYIDAERILCEEQAAIIPLYSYTFP